MDAFDKYYLFDHDGNKMFSVTPHFKDGRHLVVGIKETKFNGRRWYLDDYELKIHLLIMNKWSQDTKQAYLNIYEGLHGDRN